MPADQALMSRLSRRYRTQSVRFLGGGTFGEIYKVDEHVVKVPAANLGPNRAALLHEIKIMRALPQSPYLATLLKFVTFRRWWRARWRIGCEMPFYAGGDLMCRLQLAKVRGVSFLPIELSKTMTGIFSGLAALHASGIVHRDIKPENIFFKGGGYDYPVIGDFGLAVKLSVGHESVRAAVGGSLQYMPPELLGAIYENRNQYIAYASSDVYSAMWLLMMLWYRTYPLVKENPLGDVKEHITWVYCHNHRPDYEAFCPPLLAEKIGMAFDRDPKKRPSAQGIADFLNAGGVDLFLRQSDFFPDVMQAHIQRMLHPHQAVRLLGEGTFAAVFYPSGKQIVYKVASISLNKRRRLEQLPASATETAIDARVKAIHNEARILKKLHADENRRCGSIVSFLGTESIYGVPAIRLSYVAGVELGVYAEKKGYWHDEMPSQAEKTLTALQPTTGQICSDIICALNFLRQHEIVHRDIAFANIVVQEHEGVAHATLIDFGSAVVAGEAVDPFIGVHSEMMAPEQVRAECRRVLIKADTAQDIYAFGVLVLGILVGELPYEEYKATLRARDPSLSSLACRMQAIAQGLPDELQLFSGSAHMLLASCLAVDPVDRPSAEQLAQQFQAKGPALFSLTLTDLNVQPGSAGVVDCSWGTCC